MADKLSLETVYVQVYNQFLKVRDQIWRLRTWATSMTAAIAVSVIGANFNGSVDEGRDPVIFLGMIANSTLWLLVWLRDRSSIRLACYLWWVEGQGKQKKGWENWVFYRSIKNPTHWLVRVTSDIQFWFAIAYVSMLFWFYKESRWNELVLFLWLCQYVY